MSVVIKTPEEIEKMRELGRLAAEALDYIGDFVKPGVTTNEINQLVHDYHIEVQGGYPAPLNYGNPPYPKSCCTSVNHVICHGIPDDKPLKNGDILNIDVTIKKDGFHGDSSRMFAVGDISPQAKRLIDMTHASMMAAIEAVKPGASLGDICYACQRAGILIVGGGTPKNFALQSMLLSPKSFDLAIQLTTDTPENGGLSGATLSEAVSWGKISENAKFVTVYGDATITLPLMVTATMERLKK